MTWGEEGYKKLEGVTRGLQGTTGVTRGDKELNRVAGGKKGYKGSEGVTRGYRG